MSEDERKHALEAEFNEMMSSIGDSSLLFNDKEVARDLLISSYSNTNGDPQDVKVKKMAITDWKLSKAFVHQTMLIVGIMDEIKEIKGLLTSQQKPAQKSSSLFSFLYNIRVQACFVLCCAVLSPYGASAIEAIRKFFGGN